MIPFYIETYGCQMNVSDSEVVTRILTDNGYRPCSRMEDARLLFVNTCSIRENAEKRVMNRLDHFGRLKKKDPLLKVGVLGCMATRLKEQLLNHPAVDWVVGPDSYRYLPGMLDSRAAAPVRVQLSLSETYADITPYREKEPGVTSFVTIMRGCDNMCAYCIVPYVRGRERSRDPESIEAEVKSLLQEGFREVTLLGQNVNSYRWESGLVTFAGLLDRVARISPLLRIRYTTSHPKDMQDDVLHVMARYPNICKHIHLPVQSGSNAVLDKMNRKYTREEYLERINSIRTILPGCGISTDLIAGFCSETEEDHLQTLRLMEEARFDQAFMFQYSQRPNTLAARHYPDNIPSATKTRRLKEIITLQNRLSLASNRADVGNEFEVLVEGVSKRSAEDYFGRTGTGKVCVFPKKTSVIGDYVTIRITSCTAATLKGEII
jgi:tRNA-2-methylthio-N6-dimethylallyladenosine synthase